MKRKEMIKRLSKAWKANPSLRLGQLISAAVSLANDAAGKGGRGGGITIFYCPDDHLASGLDGLTPGREQE